MVNAIEAEQLVYRWCTGEARGTHSAQALAAVYASTYIDDARILRFADLRSLDDIRLDWALALIRGYVEGDVHIPWARVVALTALYEIYPTDDQA